ncbi:MAG TPA: AbrB/MazE/SpoVT family DNA-binding domain-containing protein [Opitutaceae bacterium]|nr:AbrB/MazE/SpoVT family DNA-binding domain-containing protein [Opitutaceae bacterium]
MIKLHLTRKGQTTFPKPLREWLGVAPGGDVLVEFSNGQATLKAHTSPAGVLARYARPKHKRTVEQSVGKYLGALDAATRDH